jgi:hypothetical protein
LSGELGERPMEGTACSLDHFGIVEVLDAQKNREPETYGRTVHLKRYTNLRILLAARNDLDACHRDLEFAHPMPRSSVWCY